VLVERSVMEQRFEAVMGVVRDACSEHGTYFNNWGNLTCRGALLTLRVDILRV
jgi:hypothetical protein